MTWWFKNIINKIKYYWLLVLVFSIFFIWWVSNADLMSEAFKPAHDKDTVIFISKDRDPSGRRILHWGTTYDTKEWEFSKEPSLIVKITRYFLMFTIAISVTVILYNGLIYIIETGKWSSWKSLIKNVVYIVVWILIALFSVVIVTILQSVWTTVNQETISKNVMENVDTSINNTEYEILV